MRRPEPEVGDPDIPQLRFLDLPLPVSFPSHHHKIVGTWYLLDFILRILKVGARPSSTGFPPAEICKQGENEKAEGAEEGER